MVDGEYNQKAQDVRELKRSARRRHFYECRSQATTSQLAHAAAVGQCYNSKSVGKSGDRCLNLQKRTEVEYNTRPGSLVFW